MTHEGHANQVSQHQQSLINSRTAANIRQIRDISSEFEAKTWPTKLPANPASHWGRKAWSSERSRSLVQATVHPWPVSVNMIPGLQKPVRP
jgi:hypothetical protein